MAEMNPFWSQRARDEAALQHARPADLGEEEVSFDLFGDNEPIQSLGLQTEGALPDVENDQASVELMREPALRNMDEPGRVTTKAKVREPSLEPPMLPASWVTGSQVG